MRQFFYVSFSFFWFCLLNAFTSIISYKICFSWSELQSWWSMCFGTGCMYCVHCTSSWEWFPLNCLYLVLLFCCWGFPHGIWSDRTNPPCAATHMHQVNLGGVEHMTCGGARAYGKEPTPRRVSVFSLHDYFMVFAFHLGLSKGRAG